MRKFLLLVIPAFFATHCSRAQAYKSSLTFQKAVYSVAAIQVPYDQDVVAQAIKDYMASKGYKDAHLKDFIIFRSVPLSAGSDAVSDAYFDIERKSRSEKDITIVSLLPVKKGETLIPANTEDSSYIGISMTYLDSLKNHVHRFSINQQILAAQKTLDKTKARMVSLKNDSGDLAKKIRNYEGDLAQNKIDQQNQTKIISSTTTGDEAGLAKAHKKMDKLMNDQADYEKKIRNYKADLDKNTEDRATQQDLFDKQTKNLEALKQRHENIPAPNP